MILTFHTIINGEVKVIFDNMTPNEFLFCLPNLSKNLYKAEKIVCKENGVLKPMWENMRLGFVTIERKFVLELNTNQQHTWQLYTSSLQKEKQKVINNDIRDDFNLYLLKSVEKAITNNILLI